MQIKATMRYHLILVTVAIIRKSTNNKCWRGCEEKGILIHYWWESKLVHPLWKTVQSFLKKLTQQHYLQQPRPGNNSSAYQQTIGLRRCDVYKHSRRLLSHKKEWNTAVCSNRDLDNITLTEVRQGKTNIMWYHLCIKSKKQYKWMYTQNGNRFIDTENTLTVTKGEWEREIRRRGLTDTNYYV